MFVDLCRIPGTTLAANGTGGHTIQTATGRDQLFRQYLNFPALIKGGEVIPHWLSDGNSFWYVDGDAGNRTFYLVHPEAGSRQPFFDLERLNAALGRYWGHQPHYSGVPFDSFTFDEEANRVTFDLEGETLTLDLHTYEVSAPLFHPTPVQKARSQPRLIRFPLTDGLPPVYEVTSPDGRWIVGEDAGNLTLRSTLDGRTRVLTDDGTPEDTWDVTSVNWAPDSRKFVATRVDYRNVKKLPVIHWLNKNEDVEWVPYTKTGEVLPDIRMSVIDIVSGQQLPLLTGGRSEDRLMPAEWTRNARDLTILALGRALRPLRVLRAYTVTGEVREVYRESITGNFPGGFMDPAAVVKVLQDGRFVWLSSRDGWPHLYLYGEDGGLVRQLTRGEFPVSRVVAVDEEAGWVYFLAHGEDRVYDQHLYRVGMDGEGFQRLTEGIGQHEIAFSPSTRYFVDTHSSIDRPSVSELHRANGDLIEVLSEADASALQGMPWRAPEEFVALASDGKTELHGVLYLPPDFDPARSYPVVEVIYGGPQIAVVPRTFKAERLGTVVGLTNFARALSAVGFITLIMDARGTPGRSQAFHDVSFGNFGRYEIPDHAEVIRQLCEARPYMDASRVGIVGGSWGGYNTLRAMLQAPDTYRVGIVCNGVGDLEDHWAHPGESIMGLREDNLDGYDVASSFKMAGNLTGKILIVGSTNDINATFSSTMKMVDAFTRADKPYDLMILHEENHHPEGKLKEYWVKRMREYFEEHLQPLT